MSYMALYRKFRPNTFSGVIGQAHIVKTLKNQMRTGRVSHAYLFCGTRGTGKTSTAKIFARAINCLSSTQEGEPCNECVLCREILRGRSVNVIEIDAASNNSVDDVREIREEVKYPPTQGEFKVYIIDEVHMLSGSAFNALLKTLEEPPPHVIFILATTDPQKVPATILSRCQRFDFRRITAEDIAVTLMGYLEEEGFSVTEDAVRYVARLGDGSMRDSLSILDQCIAFYSDEAVTVEKVLEVVGAVDRTVFFSMTKALAEKDSKQVMVLVDEMMASGRDVKQFVSDLLQHFRNLLMILTLEDTKGLLDFSEENLTRLKENASRLSPEEVIYYIERFSHLQSSLRYAGSERITLEVALLRLCSPWTEKDSTTLAARLAGLERKVAEGVQVVTVPGGVVEAEKPKSQPKKKPPALPQDLKRVQEEWLLLCSEVDDAVVKGKLLATKLEFKDSEEHLYLVCPYPALADMIQKKIEVVYRVLEKATGKSFEIETITEEEYQRWYEQIYGKKEEKAEDAEFSSLMESYFPEAEYNE